jgi:hypothetical protein
MLFQIIAREVMRPFRPKKKAGSSSKTPRATNPKPVKPPPAMAKPLPCTPPAQPKTVEAARLPPAPVRKTYEPDFTLSDIEVIERVMPFTMTSAERIWALVHAVEHIVHAGIPGAIVECGVWKGGSMMAAALTLSRLGEQTRQLLLYDTFEGMPLPGIVDRDHHDLSADAAMARAGVASFDQWCLAGQMEVKRNLLSTGYSQERIHLVPGRVEQTIPSQAPGQIALLRLDTDWYESTRHELLHLYPRLVPGGVLIIDDYGHWQGARRAVDEYFGEQRSCPLLCRIDYTGRIAVKPA